jgi:hypothetical protein
MPAGLQVFNDRGVYQIDETYVNYVLVAKGSATTDTAFSPFGYYKEISAAGRTAPMLAIAAPEPMCIHSGAVSGGTWTWRALAAFNAITFDYYIFDLAPAAGDTFGLEILNAASVPVYHTGQKPLRIAGEVVGSGDAWPPADDVIFDAGRNYAAIQTVFGFGESEVDDVTLGRENWVVGARAITGGIGYGHITYAITGGGNPIIANESVGRFLAVDVTDY